MPMQISGVTIQGGMNILPRAGAPSPTPGPAPTPGPSDPDFSNVVFMFDGDGTNGGANNTFTDSSSNSHAITKNGDVTQGSFSPYGDNWSWYTKDSAISFTNSGSGTFETSGNYTAECWVTFEGVDSSGYNIIFYGGNNTQLTIVSNGGLSLVMAGTVPINGNSYPNADMLDGNWHHVAWCRSGSTCRTFIDGIQQASASSSSTIRIDQISGYSSGYEHNGRISNVRITNTALYTSNFTPPTAPLTEVTGTHILTAQSNRIVDNSSNNRPLVIARGTPKVTPFSPFTNSDARTLITDGGSAYFEDANDDHLSIAHQPEFLISGQQFTIEFWFYPLRSGVDDHVASYNNGTTDGNLNWLFRQINNDSLRFVVIQSNGGVRALDSTSQVITNTWNHVVVTGDGSSFIKMWLNGNYEGSISTDGTNQNNTSSAFIKIAKWQNVNYKGYISDFRYVVGSQVYTGTSDITLPTAPLTAVTNTELLLNLQDSAIPDLSGLNNIDTVGNAQIDTAIKKYGTGSLEFDGTDDCLEIPYSTAFELGTQSFTIEFWINTSQTTATTILDRRLASSSSAGYLLLLNYPSQGQIAFYASGVSWPLLTSSSNISLNQWVHVAIVRNGSSFAMYFDGNSVATATSSASFNDAAAPLFIGRNVDPASQRLDGYIDDFRFTKGVARYTANFTPPTAALPKF